jgi:hypothetical protein
MSVLADIAQGETGTGDVMFLIGLILAFVAALLASAMDAKISRWSHPAGWAGLGFVGLGLLLL